MRQGPREGTILALDVGTTGVRALLLDPTGRPRGEAYREVLPTYPGAAAPAGGVACGRAGPAGARAARGSLGAPGRAAGRRPPPPPPRAAASPPSRRAAGPGPCWGPPAPLPPLFPRSATRAACSAG